MKRVNLFLCVAASIVTLLSSSVWEGSAAMSEDLPETGFYIATNSYPINTIVDVTNLENDRIIRLLVSSRLENSGFLALLSKDAAESLGINDSTLGRIRMSESVNPVAYSRFIEGKILVDDSVFGTSLASTPSVQQPGSTGSYINERVERGERIVDLPDVLPPQEKIPLIAQTVVETLPLDTSYPESTFFDFGDTQLALVPSEERPPEIVVSTIPEDFPGSALTFVTYPENVIYYPRSSSPVINKLESGKYYLQLASYSRSEYAEDEISKIDNNLPVAIMNAEVAGKSYYRVLVGPVNLGESGALLQRFKVSYQDAFVWVGR